MGAFIISGAALGFRNIFYLLIVIWVDGFDAHIKTCFRCDFDGGNCSLGVLIA